MFHFSHPWYLLLVLLVPPLVWWWMRSRRSSLRHPTVAALAGMPTGWGKIAFWGGAVLRGLALLCLALALAGPRWPDLKTRIRTEGIAIVMVVDVSGSMGTRDFDWQGQSITRLDAVKHVFRLFVLGGTGPEGTKLEGRPTDQIGLVVFASLPDAICPLTLSHSALVRALEEQQPRVIPEEGSTNIIDAAVVGLQRLRQGGPRRKVLILLTDGEHNRPPESQWPLSKVVRAAQALDVPIYTIDAGASGISVPEPGTPPPSVEAREIAVKMLRTLAEETGGQYFQAENTSALLDVYRSIDQKERTLIESYQYRRYHEGYPWLGLAAFVLFGGVLTLEMTLWRRVP
jgi:Ca-activated chloride channel family protein